MNDHDEKHAHHEEVFLEDGSVSAQLQAWHANRNGSVLGAVLPLPQRNRNNTESLPSNPFHIFKRESTKSSRS